MEMANTQSLRNSFPWLSSKNERSYKCDKCNMIFNFMEGMMDHFQNDHKTNVYYACSFCLENFDSSDLLLSHMQNQHIALYYACCKCNLEFSNSNELFQHVESHPKIKVEKRCNSSPGIVAVEKRYLRCGGACSRIFSDPSLLRAHVALHLGYVDCRNGHKVSAEQVCHVDHYVNYSCRNCSKSEENQNHSSAGLESDHPVSNCDDDDDGDDREVICGECSGKFNSMRKLRFHLRDYHKIDVMCYDEETCAEAFDRCGRTKASTQIDVTSGKNRLASSCDKSTCKFLCIFCLEQFTSKKQLESHEHVHSTLIDPGEKLLMICDSCDRSFRGQFNLRKHQQTCKKRRQSSLDSLATVDCNSSSLPDIVFPDSSTSNLESRSRTDVKKDYLDSKLDNREDFSCFIELNCDAKMLNRRGDVGALKDTDSSFNEAISGHQKEMTYNKASMPNIREQSRKRKLQMKGMPPGYVCHHCLKGFRSKTKFLDHYFEHDKSIKLFSCLACDSRFGYSSSVPKHIDMHLRDLGILEAKSGLNLCPKCGKNYRDRASLKRHEAMVHLKIGHLCLQCDKKFSSPQALKQHIRQHAGEFIFKCDLCEKRYANPSSLLNHKKTHSLNKLTCNICSRAFSLKHHLTRHIARHTGFQTKSHK